VSEKNIQSMIMLTATKNGCTCWRNNTGNGVLGQVVKQDGGSFLIANGRRVQFGLCVGSSDLIGIRPTVILPEHVGKTMGIFTALEVKTSTGKTTDEQKNFITVVRRLGGIAGVVRSPDEAIALLNPLPEVSP
jgi:hypothetical protein